MKKNILSVLIITFILCLLFTACGDKSGNDSGTGSGGAGTSGGTTQTEKLLTIYPSLLTVPLGQTVTLGAKAKGDKAVIWSSSDTSVATIDENGRLSPVAEGETIITVALADDASVTDACGVLVTADGNIFLWE